MRLLFKCGPYSNTELDHIYKCAHAISVSPGCFIAFCLACNETHMWHCISLKEMISYIQKIRPE